MNPAKPQPGFWMAVALSATAVGLQQALMTPVAIVDVVLQELGHQHGFVFTTHPLVLAVVNCIAFGAVIAWGFWLIRPHGRERLRFAPLPVAQLVSVILSVLGVAILLSEVDNLFRRILPIPDFLLQFFRGINECPVWQGFLLLVVVAPLTEELLFRGIMLPGLAMRIGRGKALLATALLFAAMHLNPWQFITAAPLGVIFGWWYLRTGSLTPCLVGHATVNGLWLIFARVNVGIPGMSPDEDWSSTALQPWWLDLIGLAMLAGGVWLFLSRTGDRRVPVTGLPPRLGSPLDTAVDPPRREREPAVVSPSDPAPKDEGRP